MAKSLKLLCIAWALFAVGSVFQQSWNVFACGLDCDVNAAFQSQKEELANTHAICDAQTFAAGLSSGKDPLKDPSCSSALTCSEKAAQYEKNPIMMARKMMALAYGRCDVLKLKVGQTEQYFDRDASTNCSKNGACASKPAPDSCLARSCAAMRAPPRYQLGARATSASLFGTTGIDCSGFVGSVFENMGFKYRPVDGVNTSSEYHPKPKNGSTWVLSQYGNENQDCFKNVSLKDAVLPGDLIVSPFEGQNHVAMVDTVGADPFDLKELPKLEDSRLLAAMMTRVILSKTNSDNYLKKPISSAEIEQLFNKKDVWTSDETNRIHLLLTSLCKIHNSSKDNKITIIHSSSNNGSVGIQRELADEGLNDSQDTLIRSKGVSECIQHLTAEVSKVKPEFTIDQNKWFKKSSALFGNGAGKSKILRFNPSVSGCVYDPPKIKHAHCADCCDLNANYEDLI